MSAQPLNTDIQIFRTVRSYRDDHRNTNVEIVTKRLSPLIMSVPSFEILSGVLFRDTTVKDFSPYMGQASATATRGFPIVIGLFPVETFADAAENLPNVDFSFQIGRDKFLTNTASAVATEDIQGDLRARDSSYPTNN